MPHFRYRALRSCLALVVLRVDSRVQLVSPSFIELRRVKVSGTLLPPAVEALLLPCCWLTGYTT